MFYGKVFAAVIGDIEFVTYEALYHLRKISRSSSASARSGTEGNFSQETGFSSSEQGSIVAPGSINIVVEIGKNVEA
ncbi:hypothetical protein N7539_009412 [Penicillium diatomitis]|uniref:Uncharacterized protein n=1 Tax=Penicillium diatomitis TaxID=2819901 RepID=A0A9W9WKF1_9EURO|nr:uncharacterized protein N7539_009412 [Penicillium diatomitis]KAJ5466683.1 hypothetical protein N7539_009412 [Penicillium diatomitis]